MKWFLITLLMLISTQIYSQQQIWLPDSAISNPDIGQVILEPCGLDNYPTYGEYIELKPLNFQEVKKRIEYPKADRDMGNEGKVVLRMLVRNDGIIQNVLVVKHGTLLMDKAVLKEIWKLRFEPFEYKEGNCSIWVSAPFPFKLMR